MNVFQERRNKDNVLEERFIQKVLREESQGIKEDQEEKMARFKGSEWRASRNFSVSGTTMDYRHLPKHRFVDMKTRTTRGGKIKKRHHPIHNRILYGHANNLVRGISFGFTAKVIEDMKKLDGEQI